MIKLYNSHAPLYVIWVVFDPGWKKGIFADLTAEFSKTAIFNFLKFGHDSRVIQRVSEGNTGRVKTSLAFFLKFSITKIISKNIS